MVAITDSTIDRNGTTKTEIDYFKHEEEKVM